jgi:hypothetical protein
MEITTGTLYNKNDHIDDLVGMQHGTCKIMQVTKGHSRSHGKSANIEKNRSYLLEDEEGSRFAVMYCEKDALTKVSCKDIEKVLAFRHSWYLLPVGYIGAHCLKEDGQCSILYLHQFITGHHGHGKGQLSVDHINRDKLDNRVENLRITTPSVQNANCGKRDRKYNAQELPPELHNLSLPKYVYYACETLHADEPNEYVREFFRIEKHPNLKKKAWSSSKSVKKSILDKLVETKQHLSLLDNPAQLAIAEELDTQTYKLPADVRLNRKLDRAQLVFDRRQGAKRYTMRATVRGFEADQLESYAASLLEEVRHKYPELDTLSQ